MSRDRFYAARLTHSDGRVEDVTDKVEGISAFFEGWRNDVEQPDQQHFAAWANADEGHPAGQGRAGYRAVFKTLRMVPMSVGVLVWPNVRVKFFSGDVTFGGAYYDQTLPTRSPAARVVPEHGRVLVDAEGGSTYVHCPNLNFSVVPWEETLQQSAQSR